MSKRSYIAFSTLCMILFICCTSTANSLGQKTEYYLHPDTGLNISQLLERHGYPFENHIVQTQDGYLLGVHRIPYGVTNTSRNPDKPIALLVHGLLSQSTDFVNNEPYNSLGLLLADKGYDVWMLNCRGNTHSRKHVNLDPDTNKKQFWDFSWHEMGIYDLPNTIDYILDITKQRELFYIGHSQRTTTFFVMASELPEYNEKIRHMTALAPLAYLSHNQDIKWSTLARMSKELELAAFAMNLHEFLSHRDIYLEIIKNYCLEGMETFELCTVMFSLGIGYSPTELNMTLFPVHVSNDPSGMSVKQGLHFLQGFNNGGCFRQYDHGKVMNLIKYGQATPPDYKLTNILAPATLHYAKEDQFVNFQDVEILCKIIPNAEKRLVPLELFTHVDFIWGNHAKSLVYDYVFEEMMKY